MDSKHFWELIEESNREATGNPTNQAAILARTLAAYSTDQIIEFETFFVEYLSRAYDARLMAASAIIVEDMDDDDFLDCQRRNDSGGKPPV